MRDLPIMNLLRLPVIGFTLLTLAVTWLLYSEPHVRTYLCPACTGFREIAPRIYVDQKATDAEIDAALLSFAAGQRMVLDFYPDQTSNPVWLLCLSGQCGVRNLPRPLAMAYVNWFVFAYPDGANATIFAHELAHAELYHRVGSSRRFFSQAVPAWFDEGLSVYISQDTRYLDVEDGEVMGCKAGDWPQPPLDQRTFRRLGATQSEEIYTASACRVIEWLERHGGAEAVVAMLRERRAGDVFRE